MKRLTPVALALALLAATVAPAAAQGSGDVDDGDEAAPPRLTTPILSPRRTPGLVTAVVADERLASDVAGVLADAPASTCSMVEVGDTTLVAHSPDLALVPASNQKLLTAAAVLATYGPDLRLTTTVAATAQPEGETLPGDLVVVGGGDPSWVTSGYRQSLANEDQRPVTDLAVLADAITATGIREVQGSVVGDGTRHGDGTSVPSWHERYLGVDVGALGALSVNDGRSGYDRSPGEPTSQRPPGDPALLFASTLTTLLEERGVVVRGEPTTGVAPPGAVVLVQHPSPAMGELVRDILSFSDNETAETIVRELGVWSGGTTVAGLEVVRGALVEMGVPLEGVALVDGSGLDTANRVTCPSLMAVLAARQDDPGFVEALAVGGRTGSLRNRFVGTAAEGRLKAKTGSLNAVSSLSGYVEPATDGGEVVRFSLVQNYEAATDPAVGYALQDRLVDVLARYPDRPALDEVLPKPVGTAG